MTNNELTFYETIPQPFLCAVGDFPGRSDYGLPD